jgi:hypothetical protein
MNETAEDLARWLTNSEEDAQAMLASFRQGKPPRRPEFGKRGLAGYVEDMQAAGHPVTVGVDVAEPGADRTASLAARVAVINRTASVRCGFAPEHRQAHGFAPELDALACDECKRQLLPGETKHCRECASWKRDQGETFAV